MGARPRHARMPVNLGSAGPNRRRRIVECSPSAPMRMSPVACAPSSKCRRTLELVLLKVGATCAKVDRIRLMPPNGIHQHGVQVAAMHEIHGRAKPLGRCASGRVKQRPGLSCAPQPDHFVAGLHSLAPHRGLKTKRKQNPRSVRRELKSRADLAQLGRLLVEIAIDAALKQGQRGGQSANAGPGYQYPRRSPAHSQSVLSIVLSAGGALAPFASRTIIRSL